MDHDLDLGFWDIEEPPGFNDLKTFVHEGSRIDRDLGAHFPVGMLECPFGCDLVQFLPPQGPESPSGCSQDQAADIFFAMAFQRLEDCTVFAVDREDPN